MKSPSNRTVPLLGIVNTEQASFSWIHFQTAPSSEKDDKPTEGRAVGALSGVPSGKNTC